MVVDDDKVTEPSLMAAAPFGPITALVCDCEGGARVQIRVTGADPVLVPHKANKGRWQVRRRDGTLVLDDVITCAFVREPT